MSADPNPTGATPPEGDDMVAKVAERLGARVNAASVYGAPVERNGVTVIPVASARFVFGGGSGNDAESRQHGGGAGGAGRVAPTGYIELSQHGSRYVSIHGPERMALLAIAGVIGCAAVIAAAAGSRLSQGRRRGGIADRLPSLGR
jgi:uncharacterized spore protein YtfJ